MENKALPLLISAAVVGISGYFIYKALKPKSELIVQYYSDEEMQAASIIRSTLNPDEFIHGWFDVRTLDKPLIVIGGQYANPVYNDLIVLAGMPEITETMTDGYIYVRTYNGQTVYGVAGWTVEGTLAAANYIKENGLPTGDVIVPV